MLKVLTALRQHLNKSEGKLETQNSFLMCLYLVGRMTHKAFNYRIASVVLRVLSHEKPVCRLKFLYPPYKFLNHSSDTKVKGKHFWKSKC
jgi:hypothetical protein